MTSKLPRARMFFALWPNDAISGQLARVGSKLHRELGGKPTRDASVHMTLLFLGDVELERLNDLRESVSVVTFKPFQIIVNTCGGWGHHGGTVWVGPAETPAIL